MTETTKEIFEKAFEALDGNVVLQVNAELVSEYVEFFNELAWYHGVDVIVIPEDDPDTEAIIDWLIEYYQPKALTLQTMFKEDQELSVLGSSSSMTLKLIQTEELPKTNLVLMYTSDEPQFPAINVVDYRKAKCKTVDCYHSVDFDGFCEPCYEVRS